MWSNLVQFMVKCGPIWPSLWSNVVQFGPVYGQMWSNLVQLRSNVVQFGPVYGEMWSNLAQLGRVYSPMRSALLDGAYFRSSHGVVHLDDQVVGPDIHGLTAQRSLQIFVKNKIQSMDKGLTLRVLTYMHCKK